MRKTRRPKKFKPQLSASERFLRNEQILSPRLRVIDENGMALGVLLLSEAIRIAKEKEMDIVEVSPKENPPVAKILSYGKFQYQLEKKARKLRAKQKKIDTKGLRLSLRISKHDLDVRKKQMDQFLADGNKVRIEINLKGREKHYIAQAKTLLDEFLSTFEHIKIEQALSEQYGRVTILIAPHHEQKPISLTQPSILNEPYAQTQNDQEHLETH